MGDRLLDEFLDFLRPYLTGSKELKKLIKLRFVQADEKFRNSREFSILIHRCRANIQKNRDRPYVFIKDFSDELKAYKKKSSKPKKSHKRKHGSDTDTPKTSDVPSKKSHVAITETDSSKNAANVTKPKTDVTKVDDVVTQSNIVNLPGNNADSSDRVGTKEIRLSEFPGDPEVSSTWSPSVSPRSRVKVDDEIAPSTSFSKVLSSEDYKNIDSPDPGVSNLLVKEDSYKVSGDPTLSQVESSEVEVCENSTPILCLDSNNSNDSFKSDVKLNSNIAENTCKAVNDENICSKPCKVDSDVPVDKEALAATHKLSIDLAKECVEISEASTSNYKEIESKSPGFDGAINSKEAIPVEKCNNSTCKEGENKVKSSEKGDNSASTLNKTEKIEPSLGKGDDSVSICNEAENAVKGSGKDNNSASTYKKGENTVKSSEKVDNSVSTHNQAVKIEPSFGKGDNSASICNEAESTAKSSPKGNNCELKSVQKHDDTSESIKTKPTSKLESDLKVSQETIFKIENSESPQEKVLLGLKLVPKRVELLPAMPSTSTQPTCFGQSISACKTGTNTNSEENTPFLSEHKTVANEKHIRRLEILLAKLRNEIEKVKERELSLDELGDDDSSYLYEDKLQKKFVKVWDKLCELKGRRKTTGRPTEQRFTYEGTRYPEVNKKIESFINKKKIFPDFSDIRNIIIKANKRKSLNLSTKLIEMVAVDAFTDVGNQLQERRKEDYLTTFGCRMTDEMLPNSDPALKDKALKQRLDQNRTEGQKKLAQVITKFAEEQITRGEVPEEVGDQSDEEKRETSCSPTNEEEGEELDIPELIEDMTEEPEKKEDDESEISDENKLKEKTVCSNKEKELNNTKVKTNDENKKDEIVEDGFEIEGKKNYKRTKYIIHCDEKVVETDSENSVIDLSTDEQQDEDQSEDNDEQSDNDDESPNLPKTYASILTMMNIHENLDSPCSSESKSIKGVIDADQESIATESSTGIYMDIAEDSDLPSVNESSTPESSDSDITEIFKPVLNKIKSPAKCAPTWKLSIRTPQKSIIRKALGLKPSSRSPKTLNVNKKRPSVCIVEESTEETSHSISSKRFKISLNASFTAETTKKVKTMKSAAASTSEVIPIDDPIISSSTGDPDKGGNSDDIIILD